MNIDYQGIATLIAAIAAAVVSIIGAVASFRNHAAIKQVEKAANGLTNKLVVEAHSRGQVEGQLAAKSGSYLLPPPPAEDLGPIDSGPPL